MRGEAIDEQRARQAREHVESIRVQNSHPYRLQVIGIYINRA